MDSWGLDGLTGSWVLIFGFWAATSSDFFGSTVEASVDGDGDSEISSASSESSSAVESSSPSHPN